MAPQPYSSPTRILVSPIPIAHANISSTIVAIQLDRPTRPQVISKTVQLRYTLAEFLNTQEAL